MRKILFIFLCFISCQDEISLNFPIESQQLVIEGGIEPNMPPYVILSKNQGYFDEITIEIYNKQLIEHGTIIHKERISFLKELEPVFNKYLNRYIFELK